MNESSGFIQPQWPRPDNVAALITTRAGPGNSLAPFDHFNLATHVGDAEPRVRDHRNQLAAKLGAELHWLRQTHSCHIANLDQQPDLAQAFDGSYTGMPRIACAVMTADCLPVLLCDQPGRQVMALHAGWRGLAAGILSQGLSLFASPAQVSVYLGPAISVAHFEVGSDVKQAFLAAEKNRRYAGRVSQAFQKSKQPGKYFANLYQLARMELEGAGVASVYGGEFCTYRQSEQFYSYRRDGKTGRFASLIWLTRRA